MTDAAESNDGPIEEAYAQHRGRVLHLLTHLAALLQGSPRHLPEKHYALIRLFIRTAEGMIRRLVILLAHFIPEEEVGPRRRPCFRPCTPPKALPQIPPSMLPAMAGAHVPPTGNIPFSLFDPAPRIAPGSRAFGQAAPAAPPIAPQAFGSGNIVDADAAHARLTLRVNQLLELIDDLRPLAIRMLRMDRHSPQRIDAMLRADAIPGYDDRRIPMPVVFDIAALHADAWHMLHQPPISVPPPAPP